MKALISRFETLLNAKITGYDRVSGGDINQAFRLHTSSKDYFLKTNDSASAFDMLHAESLGLTELQNAGPIRIPKVIKAGVENGIAFLLMEFIDSQPGTPSHFQDFGKQLAKLHIVSQPHFGLQHDNYIGTLPQTNTPSDTWSNFYLENRLIPQFNLAVEKQLLLIDEIPNKRKLSDTIGMICEDVQPCLLHGDLWSGNFLIDRQGHAALFDPAVYYGDRMADIAMSQLFGGFDDAFYEGYFSESPTITHATQKIDLYQLYYLLVHLNLFGRSYKPAVMSIIKRLF